jgi:hypothetical protein
LGVLEGNFFFAALREQTFQSGGRKEVVAEYCSIRFSSLLVSSAMPIKEVAR